MNAAMTSYAEHEFDYQIDCRDKKNSSKLKQSRRASYRRGGSQPKSFNGIHRRRRRRIKW